MIDLSPVEQDRVRVALRVLHAKAGAWKTIAPGLGVSRKTIVNVACGVKGVSARMALRTARMAGVSFEDLVTGKYPPPGTCRICGHSATA